MSNDRINQAVDRLANALYELGYRSRISIKPDIRLMLCPGEQTTENAGHFHTIGLTPELVETLANAVELLITADKPGPQFDQSLFNAHLFALSKPDVAAQIRDAFVDIDPDDLSRAVLKDTAPQDRPAVTRALAAMFRTTEQDQQEDGDDA